MPVKLPDIRLNYQAEEIPEAVTETLRQLESKFKQIEAIPIALVNFKNVVARFSQVLAKSHLISSPILFLQHVSSDENIRQASRLAEERFNMFNNQIFMREALYLRFKQINPAMLDSIQKKLLQKYLKLFEEAGMELESTDRQKLYQLKTESDGLIIEFDNNISEDDSHLMFTTMELLGLDAEFLNRTQIPEKPGYHKITHKYPDTVPILEYCDLGRTREAIMAFKANRCPENLKILEKLHQLRTEIAHILGYPNYTEMQLSDQMLNTGQAVEQLLETVLTKLDLDTSRYIDTLAEMKNAPLKPTYYKRRRLKLGSADYLYYHHRYLKEHCQVDHQEIKKYFPADHVITAMMNFYSQMFGLNFRQTTSGAGLFDGKCRSKIAESWHETVTIYAVSDKSTDQAMGYFYLDLYPRPGKYTHYAMWDLVAGSQDNNGDQILPVACLVGNFPEPVEMPTSSESAEMPTGTESSNLVSLLTIDEVETMFHEFGHVLHGICGGTEAQYHELSGTNTETDFVESPSQMKEQWVYEPAILKMMSCHYQTGECLPDELINSLIASRHVGACYDWSRTAAMALVDLKIHQQSQQSYQNMVDLMKTTMERHLYHPYTNERGIATWGHLGSDSYSSRYYSYVWSMILASDLYSRFIKEPTNPQIGLEYREKILNPGGSKTGFEMVRNFLGREPTIESFLKNYIGLSNY